jgi:hypothetical protein
MLNSFPRYLPNQVLNRSMDFSGALRHQHLAHFDHQSLRVVRRIQVRSIQHKDQKTQRPHRITIGFLQEPLREGLDFTL